MMILSILSGMAIAFMLYVLLNFWKDGRRTELGDRRIYKIRSLDGDKPKVFVATQLSSFEAGRGGKCSLIRFPLPEERDGDHEIPAASQVQSKRSA